MTLWTDPEDVSSQPDDWGPHVDVDVDQINGDLSPGAKTVDVAIYYANNFDEAHHDVVNEDLLLQGFATAKEVFGAVGVQLKLVAFNSGSLDPSLFAVRASKRGRDLPMTRFTNLYEQAERQPAIASDEVLEAFNLMIGDRPGNDLVVHLVALQAVFMEWLEPVVEGRVYQPQLIETGGLSFPGYMHGDCLPRHLRGAITITNLVRTDHAWKTVAHELGHKLLNVSHEYRDVSPQHEVLADGGLMLYGQGVEIPSGSEGRYHYERLHRSPFLYVEEGGVRTYNSDYAERGFYYDPIYEGVSVEF